MSGTKNVYSRDDYRFVWGRRYSKFFLWRKNVDEDVYDEGDVYLDEFLPLTDHSLSLLTMLHPDIPIDELVKSDLNSSQVFKKHTRSPHQLLGWYAGEWV